MFKQLSFILLIVGVNVLNAQTNWTVKDPFEQKNFIENKGQFDKTILPNKEPVLYTAHIDGVNYYFTKNGYTIGRNEKVKLLEEEIEELKQMPAGRKEEKKEENEFKYKTAEKFHELKWMNTGSVKIISENKVSNYYSYSDSDLNRPNKNSTIKASAYKKLVYKNIYPNTDIIYEFPKDSSGIKYSIHLHPGADVSEIKFNFPGNNKIQNKNDNIEIESLFGKIIDHKPRSFLADDKTILKSEFKISGNEIGFELEETINKTVIIDPWTVTPNFSGNNNGFDIDYDNNGNTYIYGGVYSGTYALLKYSSLGVLLWTYIPGFPYTQPYYGDFAVDRNSNNIYLTEGYNFNTGAHVKKINSNATLLATFGGNPNFREMWRIAFSKCKNHAVIAGGGTSKPSYQTCYLDTTLTNLIPVQYVPTTNCCHDVSLLALDNYGNCYQGTNFPNTKDDELFDNSLVKLPLPALLPITYKVNTNYVFREGSSNTFYGGTGPNNSLQNSVGYNGLTTSNILVYSYDSYVLKEWHGPTGKLLRYKRINSPAGNDSSKIYCGGVSADDCGNLFLGDRKIVRQYNADLTLINSYTMLGVIIDVNISPTGTLYVCGLGFVSVLTPKDMVVCTNGGPLSLTTTSTNATCNTLGAATATITGGIPPYYIVWNTSPIQYGKNISNVPPGTYTVTVTENLCLPQTVIDTVTVSARTKTLTILDATPVNVFSPNSDGVNDLFFPFVELTNTVGTNHFDSYNLKIFDRWGNKVFETSDSDKGWNGITSKNKIANDGVYYWIATEKSNCSDEYIKEKGFVQLVR